MKVITNYEETMDLSLDPVIAVDIEGVDLGRKGTISIIQVGDSGNKIIFDVLGKSKDDPLIKYIKAFMEDQNITKIFHDCRMDSDALFFQLDICICNVHDTQCWHELITSHYQASLNNVLEHNSLPQNQSRDPGIYLTNYEFWLIRPLTDTMKAWAFGDVASLLRVYEKQVVHDVQGKVASERYMTMTREMSVFDMKIRNVGLFIGKQGRNIKKLQQDSGTLIYPRGPRHEKRFHVYYRTLLDLERVKKAQL